LLGELERLRTLYDSLRGRVALALDKENGAVLLKEIYCDRMRVRSDVCPTRPLAIVERQSEAYNPAATYEQALFRRGTTAAGKGHGVPADTHQNPIFGASELRHWPIQLHLESPHAPKFKSSD